MIVQQQKCIVLYNSSTVVPSPPNRRNCCRLIVACRRPHDTLCEKPCHTGRRFVFDPSYWSEVCVNNRRAPTSCGSALLLSAKKPAWPLDQWLSSLDHARCTPVAITFQEDRCLRKGTCDEACDHSTVQTVHCNYCTVLYQVSTNANQKWILRACPRTTS